MADSAGDTAGAAASASVPAYAPAYAPAAVALAVVLASAGCAPLARGAPKDPAEEGRLSSSAGEPLAACTPTGVELCFNAVDDNCNGVIDEGCGLATGPVQIVVAWGDSPADIDLALRTPDGERVDTQNRASGSGFRLDRDCPSDGCGGQNFENLFFEGNDPPRGRYAVEVRLKKLQGASSPVHVRFGARLGSRTVGRDLALEPTEAHEAETFVLDL